MKKTIPVVLLIASAGLIQANTIELISLDLKQLQIIPSTLSGTFTLSNSPMAGDTATALLSFSDPSDYSPTSLMATITVGSGTPSGFSVTFSELTFTNLNGSTTPTDTRDVDLTVFALAQCPSFPCTSTGGFQDRNPAVFRSTFTITPVPEPAYGILLPVIAAGFAFRRRWHRTSRVV